MEKGEGSFDLGDEEEDAAEFLRQGRAKSPRRDSHAATNDRMLTDRSQQGLTPESKKIQPVAQAAGGDRGTARVEVAIPSRGGKRQSGR